MFTVYMKRITMQSDKIIIDLEYTKYKLFKETKKQIVNILVQNLDFLLIREVRRECVDSVKCPCKNRYVVH